MGEQEWLDRVEQLSSTWKDRCALVFPTTDKYKLRRIIFEAVWRFNEWDLKILRECLEDNRNWMLFEAHQRLKTEGILQGFWVEECASDEELKKWLIPLLPVTPDVDRPSTFQSRFSDRAGGCAGAFGLEEVGFECCQAGWRAGIRPRLRRIGGRAVAGAWPAGIRRVVRRCRGSRRVAGACRCRAGVESRCGVAAAVPAEHELVEVAAQMGAAQAMEGSERPALQVENTRWIHVSTRWAGVAPTTLGWWSWSGRPQ